MAEITLFKLVARKQALVMGQAAAGDEAQVGSNKALYVFNGDAGPHTVTIAVPGNDFTGTPKNDLVETIAAGEYAAIPLLSAYADSSIGGRAAVSWDATPATLVRCVVAL